ncbi:IS3 family transposase [Streptomyces mirabilis]|uniref:IS3 family transposase n=1 Tax=Streptomyces mirabilis TaxID=68239 RepID=UPI00076602BD
MACEHLSVQLACRVLHVAESGYSAWRDRPPSNRLVKHAWLTETIVGMHTASRGTYGSRRVHAELGLGLSIHVSHGAVELLMHRPACTACPATGAAAPST